MAQPACEWLGCDRVATGPIKNCEPASPSFQESFAEATVDDVAIKGGRAVAKFSNDEVVKFVYDPPETADEAVAPRWMIVKIGGKAG